MLRASAPKVAQVGTRTYTIVGLERTGPAFDQKQAETYYVWRMVAFQISPMSQHQCMPVMDDQYIQLEHDARRARCKELDELVDRIVNTVPKSEWHGINRWGRALGYLQ